MNTIYTSDNIYWSLGLLVLQLKHSTPYHWILHPALTAIINAECIKSRCPHYSTCQSRTLACLWPTWLQWKQMGLDLWGQSLLT